MRALIPILLLASAALAAACSSSPPTRQFASTATTGNLVGALTNVRSVALHPAARLVHPYQGRSVENLRAATDRSIARRFQDRGYQIVSPERGQRLIGYAIGVSGEMHDEDLLKLFGISAGVDLGGSQDRGGIVLVIVNPHTRTVLWRASLSAPIDRDDLDERERNRRIDAALERLLEGLPTMLP